MGPADRHDDVPLPAWARGCLEVLDGHLGPRHPSGTREVLAVPQPVAARLRAVAGLDLHRHGDGVPSLHEQLALAAALGPGAVLDGVLVDPSRPGGHLSLRSVSVPLEGLSPDALGSAVDWLDRLPRRWWLHDRGRGARLTVA